MRNLEEGTWELQGALQVVLRDRGGVGMDEGGVEGRGR